MNNNVDTGVNKAAALSKRLVSGLIDVLIVIFFSFVLFTYVATPVANNNFGYAELIDKAEAKEKEYYDIAISMGLGSYNEKSEFEAREDLTQDDKDYKAFMEDERVLAIVDELNEINDKAKPIENGMVICSALIPEAIFWLLVPLVDKKRRSVGMMIAKLRIIHRDDLEVSNKQIVYRFLSLFILQTVIFYFIFGLSVVVMSPLMSLLFMYSSITRSSIHDMIAKTKVVYEDPTLFATIEERDDYIQYNSPKMKDVIDADADVVDEVKEIETKENVVDDEEIEEVETREEVIETHSEVVEETNKEDE